MPGLDARALSRWMVLALSAEAPIRFTLLTGGRSNLTYQAVDQLGRAWAVRRPPVGELLPTAHDVGREFRVLRALEHTRVPVPRALVACDVLAVTGAPFYVMDYVDGRVLRDELPDELDDAFVASLARSFTHTLADLHLQDPDRIGLGDLGRRDGYLERQLRRWYGQFKHSTSREVTLIDEVHRRLSARVPRQARVSIVHGDYRLENCVVTNVGTIAAVLDWETCTLGDPLADLAQLVAGWPSPAAVEDLASWYAARTDLDLSNLPYYVAFVRWRTACILEAVHARYARGTSGGDTTDVAHYLDRVCVEAELAAETLAGVG